LKDDLNHTLDSLCGSERRKFENASLLLTGACGFLGYYFMRFFQGKGRELGVRKVIALDNFMLGAPEWVKDFEEDSFFNIVKFDVISDKIESVQGASDVDYVIHMASVASPTFYRKFPIETLDANIWGLRRLLDFYKSRNLKGFLFFSSSEIYGDPDEGHVPTSEDYCGNVSMTGPRACYDESKRFGETMCMLFGQKYGMPIGVARPFNNYGPGMRVNDKRVPADFAKAILEDKDIHILSDGTPTRTFCYVADAVAGYLKILLHGRYDYFNIGIEEPEISISRLAEIYAAVGREVFGYDKKVIYLPPKDGQYLTDNPQRRRPNIRKAREIVGYDPKVDVVSGVRRFLNFIKTSEDREYLW
jgi:UDP-glucuronate decarboxylase